jgi:hypothetical protein
MKTNQELAEGIYSKCYGHLDDKYHKARKIPEILDWLDTGVPVMESQIAGLADEWREYDVTDMDCH